MFANDGDTQQLIKDIATRAGTIKQLCKAYDCTKEDLQAFLDKHRVDIELVKQEVEDSAIDMDDSQVTPRQLDDLWITKKFERLHRLQQVSSLIYKEIVMGGYSDATLLREFRSYLTLAANELGQLLHRGAGEAADGDTVTYEFKGIDLDNLR